MGLFGIHTWNITDCSTWQDPEVSYGAICTSSLSANCCCQVSEPQHLATAKGGPRGKPLQGRLHRQDSGIWSVRFEAPRTVSADACSITNRACGRMQRSLTGQVLAARGQ